MLRGKGVTKGEGEARVSRPADFHHRPTHPDCFRIVFGNSLTVLVYHREYGLRYGVSLGWRAGAKVEERWRSRPRLLQLARLRSRRCYM
jgi:hypothetical protein